MPTTISVEPSTRDRLKTFGHAGMTYAEILTRLMDRFEQEEFVRELRRQYAETPREDYVDLEDL